MSNALAVEDLDLSLVSSSTSIIYDEQGIPIEFPFTPYPAQKQMISKMIQAFEHCQNAILESPTGSGKSLAILVASLAWVKHKSENIVEIPTNDNDETTDSFGSEAELSWMGDDAEKFKILISQGKFDSAFDLYNTRKINRPKTPVKSSERIIGTKWSPTSKQDIPKIYIASRTHRQIAQLINELKDKTAYSPRMSVLGSRKQYCINEQVNQLESIDDDCKTKVQNKSCSAYKEVPTLEGHPDIKPGGPKEIWDIEDLINIGTDINACPYYASRGIAQNAELVFCPYNYLIDPMIRKSMKIDLKNCILIIDEAHNIESTARDTGTFETSTSVIGLVQAEIKEVLKYRHLIEANTVLASFLSIIRNWIERSDFKFGDGEKDNKLAQCFTGDTMMKEFEKMTLTKKSFLEIYYPAFQKVLEHFEDQNNSEKNTEAVEVEEDNHDGTITIKLKVTSKKTISRRSIRVLEKLFMVLEFIFNQTKNRSNDYTLAVLKKKQTTGRQNEDYDFCLWCMNSGVIFTELAEVAHSIVLTSGTLSPMETFESELEVAFPIQLIADHVIDKSQVWAKVISSGPSNYTMTGTYQYAKQPKYLEEVALSICNAVQNIPYGVLCFFPSYAAMYSLYNYISNTNMAVKDKIMSKKKIFLEPQNKPTSEFNELLEEYYDCIKSAVTNSDKNGINGALFLAVYRGKVSEGIDFNDNNCRGVICIGIPFPSYGDKLVQLKRQYNDKKKQSARTMLQKNKILSGSEWYDIQGYRALNQALGRCIRHKKDWGAIILLENRFCEYRHSKRLSKWITPMLQKCVGSFRFAMEELLQFTNRHNWKNTKVYRLGGDNEQDVKLVDNLDIKLNEHKSNLDETYQKLIAALKAPSKHQAESSHSLTIPSTVIDDSDDEMSFENDEESDILTQLCTVVNKPIMGDDIENGNKQYDFLTQSKPTPNASSLVPQSKSLNEPDFSVMSSVDRSHSNEHNSTRMKNTKTMTTVSTRSKNTTEPTVISTTDQPPNSLVNYDLTDSPKFAARYLPNNNGALPQQTLYSPYDDLPFQQSHNTHINGSPNGNDLTGKTFRLLEENYGPSPGYNGPWHITFKPVVASDGKMSIPQPFIVYAPPPQSESLHSGQLQHPNRDPYSLPIPSPQIQGRSLSGNIPQTSNLPSGNPYEPANNHNSLVQTDRKGKTRAVPTPNTSSSVHFTRPNLCRLPKPAMTNSHKVKVKDVLRSNGKAVVSVNNANMQLNTSFNVSLNSPLNKINSISQAIHKQVPVSNGKILDKPSYVTDLPPEKPIKIEPTERYRMANSTCPTPKSTPFIVYHIKRKYLDFDANGVPSLKKIIPPKILKPMSKPYVEDCKKEPIERALSLVYKPVTNNTLNVENQISTSLQRLDIHEMSANQLLASIQRIRATQVPSPARPQSASKQPVKATRVPPPAKTPIKKSTARSNTNGPKHPVPPTTIGHASRQITQAKPVNQIQNDSEELLSIRSQAKASLLAQIWASADASHRATAARLDALKNKVDHTQLENLMQAENINSRMTMILTEQYINQYGEIPERRDKGKQATHKTTAQPVAPSSSTTSSSMTGSSSRPAQNIPASIPKVPALPKFKSELSIADQQLSFFSTSSIVKSELEANEGSSSAEVKPEPSATKRPHSGSIVEFVETASGLILPKRHKK